MWFHWLQSQVCQRIKRGLDVVFVLCGLGTLASFVAMIGWPLDAMQREWVWTTTRGILALFVVQEAVRLTLQEHPLGFLRKRWLEVSLAILATGELLWHGRLLTWLGAWFPDIHARTVTLVYLGGSQLTVFTLVMLRGLRHSRFVAGWKLAPGMIFMLSFAALILLGMLLLEMPRASTSSLGWIDALFLSTSAVCVTGLSTVDPSQVLTPEGWFILLGLIQLGGLGVITLTYFFAHFLAGGMTMRTRVQMRDFLSEDNLSRIGTVLGLVVSLTLVCEAVGAVAIHASLAGTTLAAEVPGMVFFSVFHAVSAFCNAGFSTLSAGLMDARVQEQRLFLTVIMVLITVGGLGFPVLNNLGHVALASLARRVGWRTAKPRFRAHTKLVLVTSALLTLGGAFALWVTEQAQPVVSGAAPAWFTALFNSVTARTAGFNTIAMGSLLPASVVVMIFLMYVGGSPAGTAGGVKTTTLGVAVLALRRLVQGKVEMEVFDRRVEPEVATRALTILLLSLLSCAFVVGLLAFLEPKLSLGDLTFEAVSALSTVGLTRGITPLLGDPAKIVLILTMFVGRVGVLTVVLAFARQEAPRPYRLPEGNLIVS